jgi:hypothetical protein
MLGMGVGHLINRYTDAPDKTQQIEVVSNVSFAGESSKLDKVKTEFSKIESRQDKEVIYKIFVGSAEFLKKTNSIVATSQFDPLLVRVQSSYSWDRGKYEGLTDAVSDYLISVGYDKPKELKSAQERAEFAKIFSDLAEVTKHE